MKRKTEKKLQMLKKHWALFMEDMTAPITLLVFFGAPLAIFKGYPDEGSWVVSDHQEVQRLGQATCTKDPEWV